MTSPQPVGIAPAGLSSTHHGHPDREGLPLWLLSGLIVTAGFAVGSAAWSVASGQGAIAPAAAFGLGAVAAVLALIGLPSLSIRANARAMGAVSAAGLARFGLLGDSDTTGLAVVIVWIFALVGLVVFSDQVGDGKQPLLTTRTGIRGRQGGSGTATPPGPSGSNPDRLASSLSRTLVIAFALMILTALALPHVTDPLRSSSETGDPARFPNPTEDANALTASDRLDMTQRPRASDRVVLRVKSPRATFWRGQTYDTWDGRFWAQSDGSLSVTGPAGEMPAQPDDLAVQGTDTFEQRFEMVSPAADLLYGAASPVEVDAQVDVLVRGDGAMLARQPLGAGASYTITSRRVLTSEGDLRAADEGDVPDEVLARYAADPVTTDRVRAASRNVTADADNNYDRILALQEWMGDRTKYSLDAPLAPPDTDVVDDFLFESRRGWCEQIASSLVVLARASGIPARLVSGFVPGSRDLLTGEFTVRERDAHAWTEVWFPEVGWVPFDPTADVPLAGDDGVERTWSEWLARHAGMVVLVAVGTVVLVVAGMFVARRLIARRRRRLDDRITGPPDWAAVLDARLGALGARAGRERNPSETATAYAESIGDRIRAPDIDRVGRAIDASLYAATSPTPDDQAAAAEVLDRIEADEALVPS